MSSRREIIYIGCIETTSDWPEVVLPNFFGFVMKSLIKNKGDPRELLKAYPNFDSNEVAPDSPRACPTPYLTLACFGGHLLCLKGLVACGADLSKRGLYERTPLHYACTNFSGKEPFKLVEWILSQPSGLQTINMACDLGHTPLYEATHSRDIPLIELLLDHGADPIMHYSGCSEEVKMCLSKAEESSY